MDNIFINFEISQKLKVLGFDNYCLSYFKDEEFKHPSKEILKNSEVKSWFVCCPTFEQTLHFLRTKYFINIKIEYLCSVNEVLALVGVIDFMINKYEKPDIHIQSTSLNYYEVLTETILECLNIIEKWKM